MATRRRFEAVPITRGKAYRAKAQAQARSRKARSFLPVVILFIAAPLAGLAALASWHWLNPALGNASAAEASRQFAICGMTRQTCVVDGDTIWLDGVKIRIADIDTPEISSPRCDSEYALGIRARDRMQQLLNEGPFAVEAIGSRDEDQYGRKLRVVTRNGRSLGDMLVAEGLARTWSGRREPWC
ncbi:thermonuclease family protein [Altererythrobacter sp. KTW20L]|uniref:thermonuclease family protein n=1 Tax=Altererythrobacter sp. KTW20L TaxID=2942210 RepID=UPI0020BF55C6|nr:thermonuclease family protein [Altererythrobacter sp. KTW20L]MCL6252298.1 thermonuclease family protein [Altererythrobacter sp. KTW20L]